MALTLLHLVSTVPEPLFDLVINQTASRKKEGYPEPQSEADPQAPGLPRDWAGFYVERERRKE